MQDLSLCVPNFSEGRDERLLDHLDAALSVAGLRVLDRHSDADHHRSVFTVAGSLDSLQEGIVGAAAASVKRIDLRTHRGAHPRVGAIDVVPLVMTGHTPRSRCVQAARSLGERLWSELQLPVYYYGAAATRDSRIQLETVRKHGFERLSALARSGILRPDVGNPSLHRSAGACCIGVRAPMAAFNVHIDADSAHPARQIAGSIREAGGGLPGVKALGMYLQTARTAQVSMNLTRLNETPVFAAYDAVCAAAHRLGVAVIGSELVGLAPRASFGPDPHRLQIRGFSEGMILEEHLP